MGAKVLIVEPQALWREVARIHLESWGFEVATAPDGAGAMEMLRKGDFDVVLAQLKLPDTTGFDVLAIARLRDPDMPVLLISESWPQSEKRRAESRGAVPVRYSWDWEGLRKKLSEALETRGGGADEGATPPGA